MVACPDGNSETSEWLKAVISVLTGVLVGVFAEPLKRFIVVRLTTGRAINAIYEELGRLYDIVGTLAFSSESLAQKLAGNLRMEEFDYYYSQEREAFYRIPHHAEIRALYTSIRSSLESIRSEKIHPKAGLIYIKNEIDLRSELGVLDGQRIKKIADELNARTKSQMEVYIRYTKDAADWHDRFQSAEPKQPDKG